MRRLAALVLASSTLGLVACDDGGIGSQEEFATGGIQENTREARAVLAVANQLDFELLAAAPADGGVGLSERAADNIAAYRLGDDEVVPSDDDEAFETLKELDTLPRVGPDEFKALLKFGREHGFLEAPAEPAGSGELIWASGLGGVGEVTGIGADGDGNLVFAGVFEGTLSAGLDAPPITSEGKKDGFVAKVGPDGAPLWSRRLGTPEVDEIGTAQVDAQGESLLTFWSWRDVSVDVGCGAVELPTNHTLLLKLDRDGACRWSRAVRGVRATAALAGDGRVAVISHGSDLSLLDAAGEPVATLDTYLESPALAFGPDGDLAVVGWNSSKDFGGGQTCPDQTGMQIARLGDDLAHVWSRCEPSVHGPRNAHAVAFGAEGELVVASALSGVANVGGSSIGQADGVSTLLAAFTTEGAHLWSLATRANLGQYERLSPRAVRVADDGAVYLASTEGQLVRFEPGGRQTWLRGPGQRVVIGLDDDGRLLVGGKGARAMLGLPSAGGFFGVLTP